MAEAELSDSILNAMKGTEDAEQEVYFPDYTSDNPHYTAVYRMLYRLLTVARRAGDLRVFKDGALTFGVRPGRYADGDTLVDYAGAAAQALTNNATNYIYLTAAGELTVNTTGFPVPSTTPHIPLATIVTAGGDYDGRDVADGGDIDHTYRARAIYQVCGPTDVAKLAAAVQDLMPNLLLTGADDGDGTGSCTIQARDAANNNLAQRFLVRTWIADAEYSEPDPQTGFTVTTGELMRQIEANADHEVISNASGAVVMDIDAGGAKTIYVMAEADGRIYSSGAIVITTP